MLAHTRNPSTWEMEERDYCKFETRIGYIVSSRPAQEKEKQYKQITHNRDKWISQKKSDKHKKIQVKTFQTLGQAEVS